MKLLQAKLAKYTAPQEAKAAGVTAFCSKPINIEELIAAPSSLLAG